MNKKYGRDGEILTLKNLNKILDRTLDKGWRKRPFFKKNWNKALLDRQNNAVCAHS